MTPGCTTSITLVMGSFTLVMGFFASLRISPAPPADRRISVMAQYIVKDDGE